MTAELTFLIGTEPYKWTDCDPCLVCGLAAAEIALSDCLHLIACISPDNLCSQIPTNVYVLCQQCLKKLSSFVAFKCYLASVPPIISKAVRIKHCIERSDRELWVSVNCDKTKTNTLRVKVYVHTNIETTETLSKIHNVIQEVTSSDKTNEEVTVASISDHVQQEMTSQIVQLQEVTSQNEQEVMTQVTSISSPAGSHYLKTEVALPSLSQFDDADLIDQFETEVDSIQPKIAGPKQSPNEIGCGLCDKIFQTKSRWRYHMQQHNKRFQCSICGYRFPEKWRLKIHLDAHAGLTQKIHCDICNKNFSKVGYVYHQRIHTGEKPELCKVCGLTFRTTMALRRHMQVHTGHKPFQCGECDKSFSTRHSSAVHLRTHSGERPYQCSECGKTYVCKEHLRRHMKISHQSDSTVDLIS